jgi:hypothetical protein
VRVCQSLRTCVCVSTNNVVSWSVGALLLILVNSALSLSSQHPFLATACSAEEFVAYTVKAKEAYKQLLDVDI